MVLNDVIYIASCVKDGGIVRFQYQDKKGYVQEEITAVDSPMYMIMLKSKMHILLRAPFYNSQSGYVNFEVFEKGKLGNPSKLVSTKGEIAETVLYLSSPSAKSVTGATIVMDNGALLVSDKREKYGF